MVEKTEEYTLPAQTSLAEPSQGGALPVDSPEIKPAAAASPAAKSKGEKWYDWIVYSGINYWFNLGISLIIADAATHGKGKKALGKAATFFGGKNDKGQHNAQVALEQLALNSGGWLLLVPMKLMEDRKRSLVHWLNDKFGVSQTAPDGHALTADEIYIEQEQPKQGWLRVVGRRVLASGSTMVAGVVLDSGFPKTLDHPVTVDGKVKTQIGGKERFTDFIVAQSNRALNSGYIPGGRSLAQKEWVQRYLGLAALDVINTKITAVVMKVTNGAKKIKMPKEIDPGDLALPVMAGIGVPPPAEDPATAASSIAASIGRKTIEPKSHLTHAQRLAAEPSQSLQQNL
jgi:hypothetical protein